MATALGSKKVTMDEMVTLRGKLKIQSEQDHGLLSVVTGRHPTAGFVALISAPEASGCLAIGENVETIS